MTFPKVAVEEERLMAHGAWRMAHGAWGMAHGAWGMGHSSYSRRTRSWAQLFSSFVLIIHKILTYRLGLNEAGDRPDELGVGVHVQVRNAETYWRHGALSEWVRRDQGKWPTEH